MSLIVVPWRWNCSSDAKYWARLRCRHAVPFAMRACSTCAYQLHPLSKDLRFKRPLPISKSVGMSRTAVTSDGSPIFDVVQSWGVASARHTSGCLVYPHLSSNLTNDDGKKKDSFISPSSPPSSQDCCVDTEYLFDVPIGPSIVRWDFQTKRRVLQFQAHCDVVTSMRMSPDQNYIATSCFSGEVKLWSPQWACLDYVTAPISSQHHVGEICNIAPTCKIAIIKIFFL